MLCPEKIAINPLIGKINVGSLKVKAVVTGSQTIMFAMSSEFTAQSVASASKKTGNDYIRQKKEIRGKKQADGISCQLMQDSSG